MFKLAKDEEILDVSADVGYGDPGRFYISENAGEFIRELKSKTGKDIWN